MRWEQLYEAYTRLGSALSAAELALRTALDRVTASDHAAAIASSELATERAAGAAKQRAIEELLIEARQHRAHRERLELSVSEERMRRVRAERRVHALAKQVRHASDCNAVLGGVAVIASLAAVGRE